MLLDIQREWTSNGSMKNHIDHLRGDVAGGLNGSTLLRSENNPRNTFDDAAVDQLFNDKNHDWIFVNSDTGILDSFGPAKHQDELDPAVGIGVSALRMATDLGDNSTLFDGSKQDSAIAVRIYSEKFVLDTNGDGSISPLNVLTIINHLNSRSQSGEGVSAASTSDALQDIGEELLRSKKRFAR